MKYEQLNICINMKPKTSQFYCITHTRIWSESTQTLVETNACDFGACSFGPLPSYHGTSSDARNTRVSAPVDNDRQGHPTWVKVMGSAVCDGAQSPRRWSGGSSLRCRWLFGGSGRGPSVGASEPRATVPDQATAAAVAPQRPI